MAQLADVNTTDLLDAISLGCRTMSSTFNADDNDIPFFRAAFRREPELEFSWAHTEAHVPGRHLNALLSAEARSPAGRWPTSCLITFEKGSMPSMRWPSTAIRPGPVE